MILVIPFGVDPRKAAEEFERRKAEIERQPRATTARPADAERYGGDAGDHADLHAAERQLRDSLMRETEPHKGIVGTVNDCLNGRIPDRLRNSRAFFAGRIIGAIIGYTNRIVRQIKDNIETIKTLMAFGTSVVIVVGSLASSPMVQRLMNPQDGMATAKEALLQAVIEETVPEIILYGLRGRQGSSGERSMAPFQGCLVEVHAPASWIKESLAAASRGIAPGNAPLAAQVQRDFLRTVEEKGWLPLLSQVAFAEEALGGQTFFGEDASAPLPEEGAAWREAAARRIAAMLLVMRSTAPERHRDLVQATIQWGVTEAVLAGLAGQRFSPQQRTEVVLHAFATDMATGHAPGPKAWAEMDSSAMADAIRSWLTLNEQRLERDLAAHRLAVRTVTALAGSRNEPERVTLGLALALEDQPSSPLGLAMLRSLGKASDGLVSARQACNAGNDGKRKVSQGQDGNRPRHKA